MAHAAGHHKGDNLHILVRVHEKPLARLDDRFGDGDQRAIAVWAGINGIVGGEAADDLHPAPVGSDTVAAFEFLDHGSISPKAWRL